MAGGSLWLDAYAHPVRRMSPYLAHSDADRCLSIPLVPQKRT